MLTWLVARCYCVLNQPWLKLCSFLQELLESHFSHDTPPPSSPPLSFSLLTNALNVYLRMCMHKRAESEDQEEFGQRVQEVLTWAERVLLPALSATTRWALGRSAWHCDTSGCWCSTNQSVNWIYASATVLLVRRARGHNALFCPPFYLDPQTNNQPLQNDYAIIAYEVIQRCMDRFTCGTCEVDAPRQCFHLEKWTRGGKIIHR